MRHHFFIFLFLDLPLSKCTWIFHDRGPYHVETRSLICYWFLCDRDLHHERVNMSLFSTHFNLVVLIKLVLIKRVYMDDYGALNETSQSNFSHCVKCDQIRSFFWSIFSRIRTKYGETRSNSVFEHFSWSEYFIKIVPVITLVFGKSNGAIV